MMADYFTQFSTILKLDDAAMAQRALAFFEDVKQWGGDHLDGDEEPAFDLSIVNDEDTGALSVLWIHAEEDGSPSHVVSFVLALGRELGLQNRWGFAWTNSCSRPEQNAFGGGAVYIDFDGDRSQWLNTSTWLEEHGVNF